MSAQDLAYSKFVSLLIDSGVWATMSSAARTLYPVLLRFSDGNFKPVFPGGKLLLKLTGFKQKSTLRKARNELVDLGLIAISSGSGRKNTFYHFRFDTLRGSALPPTAASQTPGEAPVSDTLQGIVPPARGFQKDPPYNKIHISINNNVHSGGEKMEAPPSELRALGNRFGEENLSLALSECRLAGIPETHENLEKILYRSQAAGGTSWAQIEKNLIQKISRGSLLMIEKSFLGDKNGVLFFADSLPEYLKELLRRESPDILFEPFSDTGERRMFWKEAGLKL